MTLNNILNNHNIENYDYDLPKELIAFFPAEKRENSRLLYADAKNKTIEHYQFSDIIDLIPDNSLLAINNTKVIAARIPAKKTTGGRAEILCIDPIAPSYDPQITMISHNECIWKCILGGKAIRKNTILLPQSENNRYNFKATVLEKDGMEGVVKFNWENDKLTFADILTELGKIPLPPYISRDTTEDDKKRYQTVYAQNDGSVAAPTAGLHFTDSILNKLKKRNIEICNLTLHVGPGTFRPVDDEGIANHNMHEEQIFVEPKSLEQLSKAYKEKRSVIAVGTTSLRILESIYRVGINLNAGIENNFSENSFFFEQWESYNQKEIMTNPQNSIDSIINYLKKNNLELLSGRTKLLIIPGYEIKTISGLITNYHLPKSTLLMLVSAFVGDDFRKEIYKTAIEEKYNFLSYGDSSFLFFPE